MSVYSLESDKTKIRSESDSNIIACVYGFLKNLFLPYQRASFDFENGHCYDTLYSCKPTVNVSSELIMYVCYLYKINTIMIYTNKHYI